MSLCNKLVRSCVRASFIRNTKYSLSRCSNETLILNTTTRTTACNSRFDTPCWRWYSNGSSTTENNTEKDESSANGSSTTENNTEKDENSANGSSTTENNTDKDENHDKSENEVKTEILENALSYVPTHGWSREALALGAEEAGYPSVAEGMFHRGEVDLVLYLVRSNNENLIKYMEDISSNAEGEKIKTNEFIQDVLEHRLRMIIPYIDVWSDAMAVLLQPTVVVEATQELGKMVDDIWFYAGDTSTDFNWYTKRGLLAKLFISVQTVMVKDQSPDFADSWRFLDRRMKDIATFGKISRSIQRQSTMAADAAFAGFTVLRNVAGLGERRR